MNQLSNQIQSPTQNKDQTKGVFSCSLLLLAFILPAIAFAFGAVGFLMRAYGYSRVTFAIGFVLADYVERRPECDARLLACAGLSGGGLQTLWFAQWQE